MNKRQNEILKKAETHTAAIGTAKVLQLFLYTAVGGTAISGRGATYRASSNGCGSSATPQGRQPPTITGSVAAGTCINLGKLSLQLLACSIKCVTWNILIHNAHMCAQGYYSYFFDILPVYYLTTKKIMSQNYFIIFSALEVWGQLNLTLSYLKSKYSP